MRMETICFKLNGKDVSYSGDDSDRLLDVLKKTFGLNSLNCGCKEGSCGACSVLLDGKLVNSCLIAVGYVRGKTVLTLEGYTGTERFRVLESAFAEMSAVQCGFCTPGMIMATEALLSRNPHPTDSQIREGISGNICRCTGYNAIVSAINKAAQEGDGLW